MSAMPDQASKARDVLAWENGRISGETEREPSPLERARRHLEREELELAVSILESLQGPPALALLGVAQFRAERYAEAVTSLTTALADGAHDVSLRELLARAKANVEADVARAVPSPLYFSEQSLPAAPKVESEVDRVPIEPPQPNLRERLLHHVGNAAGLKVGLWLRTLTERLGREGETDTPWTTWYEHGFVKSMLMLARRRERLNREQLFAAYPPGAKTSFFEPSGPVPEAAKWARTADGSYNDLDDPMAGAANTRFGFNTAAERNVGEVDERLLTPNPRTVSRELLARERGFQPIPFLNLLAAPWIQFMNHDWVSYGDPADVAPYRIPLDEDDPVRKTLHQTHMLVRPTQPDPSKRPEERFTTHLNEVTSWWDGSQLYGSDLETQHALRSHVGGKLRVDERTGNLPVLPDGVEETGFRRNWWLGLTLLHTLFVKEHNTICDVLAAHYPRLGDQQLFDIARLVNTALLAKIHTVEWTPAVLPNRALNAAMNSNWYGFLTNLLRAKNNRQALAEINVADPLAGGLVGNATDNHGVPYSLTREFLAVYRLHSLLPDTIDLHGIGSRGKGPLRTVSLAETRQAAAHKITQQTPLDDLFYSFGIQHSGQLVLNNYPDTLRNLSIPHAGFYDLAAVDILRDRERGVPRYNQFRRALGLRPVNRFEDITTDAESLQRLRKVYETVEDVDLLVGNLAEQHRPTGFGFGETLFEVFILNASRRLQADRFFTECYDERHYTSKGLEWVDRNSLKDVLLRHYPRLHATGLVNVENAFEPWDTGPLDPARHPLRQFDARLRESDEARAITSR